MLHLQIEIFFFLLLTVGFGKIDLLELVRLMLEFLARCLFLFGE